MNSYKLYNEIEKRVNLLDDYMYPIPLPPEQEIARLGTILHFFQVGEDSLNILNGKLERQGRLSDESLAILKDYKDFPEGLK